MRHLYPFFAGSRKSCFENQVYLELRRAGYTVFVGVLRGGKLVDFVGRKKDRIVYLQCAPLLNDDFQVEQMYNMLEMYKTIMKSGSFLWTIPHCPPKKGFVTYKSGN